MAVVGGEWVLRLCRVAAIPAGIGGEMHVSLSGGVAGAQPTAKCWDPFGVSVEKATDLAWHGRETGHNITV